MLEMSGDSTCSKSKKLKQKTGDDDGFKSLFAVRAVVVFRVLQKPGSEKNQEIQYGLISEEIWTKNVQEDDKAWTQLLAVRRLRRVAQILSERKKNNHFYWRAWRR